jgi:hypothetical protein
VAIHRAAVARRARSYYTLGVLRRWTFACVIGETLAAFVVTLLGVLVSRVVPEGSALHPLSLPLIGALEGALLGGAQARALAPLGVGARRFTLATSGGFAFAWAGGALLSLLEPAAPPSFGLVLVAGGLVGVIVGALAGFAQSGPLREAPTARASWVMASAAGWGAAMVASAVVSDAIWGAFRLEVLALETAKGALTGGLVALVTGPMLRGTWVAAIGVTGVSARDTPDGP